MSEPVVNLVLIEDDKEIRRFLQSALGASGFRVWPAETAERGLDAGADDYVTKPFGVPELLARLRALLRRVVRIEDSGKALVEFGDLRIDLAHRTVTRAGQAVYPTPLEYRMLTYCSPRPAAC